MKAMLKSELARAAGVSVDTMRRYINAVKDNPVFRGYNMRNKLLTPLQVKFLCEYYCIGKVTIEVQ